MAFSKFANAVVQTPRVGLDTWNEYRQKSFTQAGFGDRTSAISIENYSPDKYLLTHCTIIASVDVDEASKSKTGKVTTADGQEINRPHKDYLIKPDCNKYINQNGDAWERKLLLATYKTFVGAENYVEHIQIPELSKGKIIDAVARDLGETVYVDILVATDRKHKDLVAKIESGQLSTLSMGCTIAFSLCTKCGNKAIDEPDLCRHVKYEKGNKFIDSEGNIRIVAELCGHHTDPESVKFIEASWVGNPAFKGAVMRNILDLNKPTTKEPTKYEHDQLQNLIQEAHTQSNVGNPQDWTEYFLKTASTEIKQEVRNAVSEAMSGFDQRQAFDGFEDEEPADEEGEEVEEELSPIDEISQELKDKVKEKVFQDLKEELRDNPEDPGDMGGAEIHPNDTIHQSYQLFADKYAEELGPRTKSAFQVLHTLRDPNDFFKHKHKFSNTDIVTAMYLNDRDGKQSPLSSDLYVCLQKVGNTEKYGSLRTFLKACIRTLGRKVSRREAKILVERAKILN